MAAPNNNNVIRHPSPPISPSSRRALYNQKEYMKMRLIHLLHARGCQESGTDLCEWLDCDKFTDVLKHIPFCKRGRDCRYPHCVFARFIIRHWNKCQRCSLCRPVKRWQMRNVWSNPRQRDQNAVRHQNDNVAQRENENQENAPQDEQEPQGREQASPRGNGFQIEDEMGVQLRAEVPQELLNPQEGLQRPPVVHRPMAPLTPPPTPRHWAYNGHAEVQGFHHNGNHRMHYQQNVFGHHPLQMQYQLFPQQFVPGPLQYHQINPQPAGYQALYWQQPIYPHHYGYN